jgi:hypothetical protein
MSSSSNPLQAKQEVAQNDAKTAKSPIDFFGKRFIPTFLFDGTLEPLLY